MSKPAEDTQPIEAQANREVEAVFPRMSDQAAEFQREIAALFSMRKKVAIDDEDDWDCEF